MACLWFWGSLISLLFLSPPVPQLLPNLSSSAKGWQRETELAIPAFSSLPCLTCPVSSHTFHLYIFSDRKKNHIPIRSKRNTVSMTHLWQGPYVTVWSFRFASHNLFYCSNLRSSSVYVIPNFLETQKSGTTEADPFSLLHMYTAFLACSPGHVPYASLLLSFIQGYFCFACMRAKLFLDSRSVSPVCNYFVLCIFLVEPLKHCILRKFLCKYCNFYNWLSSLEFFPVILPSSI